MTQTKFKKSEKLCENLYKARTWTSAPAGFIETSYRIHPTDMVYVHVEYVGLPFARGGTTVRMPAFQLAYLLQMERTALVSKTANIALSLIPAWRGITTLRSANWLSRLITIYSTTNFIFDIFDADLKKYFEDNYDEAGKLLSTALTNVDRMLALYKSGTAVRKFAASDIQLIETLFKQWDLIYHDLNARNETQSRKAIEAMEQLKSNLGIDEVIY